MSVMATTFNALAMNITFLREEGVLKRIHGTPMPPALPRRRDRQRRHQRVCSRDRRARREALLRHRLAQGLARAGVFCIVGVSALASLGVAFSHVIPNFDAAPAYTNIVFLPVIFISGVFYDVDNAPQFLRDVAEVLPLTHIIDGVSAALVTGAPLADHLGDLAVVAAWGVVGAFFAVRGFSWQAKRD